MQRTNTAHSVTPDEKRAGAGSSLESLIVEAERANRAGDMTLVAERCRRIAGFALEIENKPLAAESFYACILANLKLGRYEAAREACRASRDDLGEYLDLVYFELLIEAASGKIENVPVLAERFMALQAGNQDHPSMNKTSGAAGQVLLMWGQALEQLRSPASAMEIYGKYLEIYPQDNAIRDRLTEMGASEKITR